MKCLADEVDVGDYYVQSAIRQLRCPPGELQLVFPKLILKMSMVWRCGRTSLLLTEVPSGVQTSGQHYQIKTNDYY